MSENTDVKKMSFEKALEELEQIVENMEDGDIPLDKMIEYFERGSALSKQCRSKLEKLEKKIEVLMKDDGGEGEWNDFDESSERKSAMTENSVSPVPSDSNESPQESDDEEFLF
jgi:exodeoxyribonuclease VII small subunit